MWVLVQRISTAAFLANYVENSVDFKKVENEIRPLIYSFSFDCVEAPDNVQLELTDLAEW
jgi:hypothetical protein